MLKISDFNRSFLFWGALGSGAAVIVGLLMIPSILHYEGRRFSPEVGAGLFWFGFAGMIFIFALVAWHIRNMLVLPAAIFIEGDRLHYYPAWPAQVRLEDIGEIEDPVRAGMTGHMIRLVMKDGGVKAFHTGMMRESAKTIVERLRSGLARG